MTFRFPHRPRVVALVLAIGIAALAIGAMLLPKFAAARIRHAAAARGFEVRWRRLDVGWPAHAHLSGLVVCRVAAGDTVLDAEELDATLRAAPLLLGRLRLATVSLDRATIRLAQSSAADADTLEPVPDDPATGRAIAATVHQRADALVKALLAPARSLPEIRLHDVSITRGEDSRLTLSALSLEHDAHAVNLAMTGTIHAEDDIPWDLLARWQSNDQLTARAEFRMADAAGDAPRPLVITLDGRVTQDRRTREVRVAEGTKLRVGAVAARISGLVAENGPRFRLALEADSLTAPVVLRSLPRPVLGPLAGLEVRGSWDWYAGFDLDLARPDSVRFSADVRPHGLTLDAAASRPSLQAIANPFTATIHLPHGRTTERELSPANPHFRPLDRIRPFLRDAVVTNEDGAFFHHHGFNTEAIGLAIAANLRSGSYRRGAGTITMQLARNLWLGHQRTLSRKGQEVVLAWLLEHLSGLTKERLLEVYLNIIEWGPDVDGADEAAHYYFDEDAADVTLPEALFLAILVPSPTKWRWRFAADGSLKPYARAQMHFIASKMAAKGWLDPALIPQAESLRVELRGAARELLVPVPPAVVRDPTHE